MHELGQVEHREGHAAVLDVVAGDQLAFRFQQVKGRPPVLRLGSDQEHHRRDGRHEEVPDVLRPDEILHAQRSGQHHRDEQGQHHRHFVADQLRHGPERPQQGVFVVATPPRHDDRQCAQRADGQHVQQTDIQIRPDHHRGEGDDGGNQDHRDDHQHRRQKVHRPVSMAGDDHFLDQELEGVGDTLDQAVGANPVRADPVLNARGDLALDPDAQKHPHHPEARRQQHPTQDIQKGRQTCVHAGLYQGISQHMRSPCKAKKGQGIPLECTACFRIWRATSTPAHPCARRRAGRLPAWR